ncbi:hypothetical protein [Georgenia sp. SUBG003]|uniref:hypothetical protein n=1 Tax=Georgenia sp. SUBG003 TaxID=1497974 RepID=UPI003AB6B3C0
MSGAAVAAAPAVTLVRVRILLIGSGAREHALARALALDPTTELTLAPGNPGACPLPAPRAGRSAPRGPRRRRRAAWGRRS